MAAETQKQQWYNWATRNFPNLSDKWKARLGKRFRLFPSILSVELTNRCNASCIMCPRQQMKRPKGIMSNSVYEQILSEAAWYQRHIHLFQPFLFGESLLHPDFDRLIRLTREKLPHPRIYISTNGAFLDAQKSRSILESQVDKLNVDIDGLSSETAQSIRKNVKLELVQENVRRFLSLRAELKSRTKLRISIIRMPQNQHEISDFVKFWQPKADRVQIVDLNTWSGNIHMAGKTETEPETTHFDFPCRHPYEELAIAWDGRATLCCLDFDLKHPIGKVPDRTLKSIWTSNKIEKAREKLEAGDYQTLPICLDCNASRYQQKSLWRYLWRNSPSNFSIIRGKTKIVGKIKNIFSEDAPRAPLY